MSRSILVCVLLVVMVTVLVSVEAAPREKRQILGNILGELLEGNRYYYRGNNQAYRYYGANGYQYYYPGVYNPGFNGHHGFGRGSHERF